MKEFGAHTKMYPSEADIIHALMRKNHMYFPSIHNRSFVIHEENPREEKTTIDRNVLDFMDGGFIIPLDLLDLHTHQIFSRKYMRKKVKFVGRPDLIWGWIDENTVDLYPVDIKTRIDMNHDIHLPKTSQVSAYNLAWLAIASPYIKNVINKLKDRYDKDIVLHSGFCLVDINSEIEHKGLEDYIDELLPKNIIPQLVETTPSIESFSTLPRLVHDKK